ncbi:MAG: lipopolysaccharide assembly protein LapB [Betaproteobacteria bacterium]|nr:lipopolysaccharide assembly protein LapB [Betaproteobacteria bacterium]
MAIFGMGWLVARIDIKQLLLESRAMPQSYFKGLNFLLSEQPDKALESLIEVTKANPEAVELQFALGSLFRRRGEIDRAVRVHQELSERMNLDVEHRTNALLELARDYQKAGLLDHAERILLDLSAKPAGDRQQQSQTLKHLLDIYVQERDWTKAVDVAERLRAGGDASANSRSAGDRESEVDSSPESGNDNKRAGAQMRRAIANYHCELALQAQQQGRIDDAKRHLDDALNANAKCVRAHLIRVECLVAAGHHGDAIATWRKIKQQDPAYLGLMAEKILSSFKALGQMQQGLAELRSLQQQYPALDLLNALFHVTLEEDGPEGAYELVKDDLRRNPTLVGLDRLLEAQILAAPEDQKADLQVLKNLVHTHSSRLAVYLCGSCGFKARQFHWQCPACGGWETFPPRLTAEYDTAERHLSRSQAEKAAHVEKTAQ